MDQDDAIGNDKEGEKGGVWTYQSLDAMMIKEMVHDMRQKKIMASTRVYCSSCESEGGRGGVFPVVGEGG